MSKLNKNKALAVFLGLGFIGYVFFGDSIVNIFSGKTMEENSGGGETVKYLKMEDLKVGSGDTAQAGDSVSVHYVGHLTNGTVFDSSISRNSPFEFILGSGQVIKGWDEGLVGMKVGGKRLLTIAPEYAYGARAIGAIPANSTLIFEVELLDVR